MVDILTPIFMCVVMPVTIVWLVMRAKRNETDKMAEIMIKAIENGIPIDPSFFNGQTLRKSLKQKQLGLLTWTIVLSVLGLASLLVGLIYILVNHFDYNTGPTVFTILLPLAGSALLAVGLALFVAYLIRRRILAKEIAAEEKALETSDK